MRLLVYVNPPKGLKVRDGEYIEGVFYGNKVTESTQIPRAALSNNRVMLLQKDSTISYKEVIVELSI